MTYISKLTLTNIRSHSDAKFDFNKAMNAVVGPNGSGKTTVLESLYTLLRGTSFKGGTKDMLAREESQFRAALELQTVKTTHNRALGYMQTSDYAIQKKWSIDNKKYARLPIAERLPVVLFEPDLARLITGSPQRRRLYIDSIASQLDSSVAHSLLRFDRIVRQRNELLKRLRKSNANDTEQLFIWNTQLAHVSEIIVQARLKLLTRLQSDISKFYTQLGGTDEVHLSYKSATSDNAGSYASQLLRCLEQELRRDIQLGYTSFGPHRDDIVITLASQPALERASRGEVRTIVIALKLLETAILSTSDSSYGVKPTLLLDDVLSELDLLHQERVLEGLKNHQVFITTTDAHALTAGVHTIFLE